MFNAFKGIIGVSGKGCKKYKINSLSCPEAIILIFNAFYVSFHVSTPCFFMFSLLWYPCLKLAVRLESLVAFSHMLADTTLDITCVLLNGSHCHPCIFVPLLDGGEIPMGKLLSLLSYMVSKLSQIYSHQGSLLSQPHSHVYSLFPINVTSFWLELGIEEALYTGTQKVWVKNLKMNLKKRKYVSRNKTCLGYINKFCNVSSSLGVYL